MLNLIVVTDGEVDDKVGIPFLQIGKDETAAKWLRELDDSLKKYDVRDVRWFFFQSLFHLGYLSCLFDIEFATGTELFKSVCL